MGERAAQIVMATRTFAPDSGAAPIRLGAVARALEDRGASVTVLTTRPARGSEAVSARQKSTGPGSPPDRPAARRVSRWPVLRDRAGRVRGYLPYLTFDLPLSLRLALSRGVDAVLVEPPPTTGAVVRVVAALRGIPYAYYAADVLSTAAAGAGVRGPALWAVRRLEGFALRGAAAVLTPSEGMADQLVALGAAAGRITVVGTGTDTDVFTPPVDSEPDPFQPSTVQPGPVQPGPVQPVPALLAHLPAEAPLAVYAGTMSEVHGTEVFVRAFAAAARRVPGARLALVGDGTECEDLATLAERLAPGRVIVTGQVPVDEVALWWRRAWVGLAAMPHYPVAYATKMFAATACGTPVVYAGPGPCAAMVESGRLGWAVPYDVDAVTEALDEALSAPPGGAARQRIATWTLEHASLRSVAGHAASAILATAAPGAHATPAEAPAPHRRSRVVFAVSAVTPLRGMERAALEVVERLRADGVDVEVVVLDPGPSPRTRAERVLRLARSSLAARTLVRDHCDDITDVITDDGSPATGPSGRTVVLVGLWVALRTLPWVAAAGRRPRIIAWEHSYTRERAARSPGFRAVARLVLPLYASRADAVVAVSAAVAGAMPRAVEDRTTVIPNPVAPETSAPVVRASRHREPVDDAATTPPVRLLALGALVPIKAPELALDTLEALRAPDVPARLDVAGDGPLVRGLAARARDHGFDVTWHGHVPDVGPLLARADVLLHTAASETFGYVLLEAAAAGVPVVAVATPQTRALVPGLVPGVTCPARGNALALGVCAVLEAAPGRRVEEARQAHLARQAAFDPEVLTSRWREVLRAGDR